MAADPLVSESLYLLTELPSRPWMPRRRGRPISKFTAIRWALTGRGGVRLKTLLVGGVRCTCDTWAFEFFESLTNGSTTAPAQRSPSQVRRDYEAAEAELNMEGIQ